MTRDQLPPLPGDFVGPYRLGPALGAGAMATVYRAQGPQGPVALKILQHGRTTPEEITRFRREYLTLARLSHPHVVRVWDAGEVNGYPWIAMELVEGLDLGHLLDRWDRDPPADRFRQAERYFRQLADALAYVHAEGVIHRDLKPGNVLVTAEGVAKLSDFGVVKDADAFGTSLTVAGRLVGTVAFMAPEQITGEAVDARADLYALGALLYMLLTGRRPIEADSIAGFLARHLGEPPRPPSERAPGVPRRLERVCLRLLEKEPSRRYPDARAALAALDAVDAGGAATLVGRTDALHELRTRVDELVRNRRGGVVAVLGPPGSGRTRLLAEIVHHAEDRGLVPLIATGAGGVAEVAARLPHARPGAGLEALRAAAEHPLVIVLDDADRAADGVVDGLGQLAWDRIGTEAAPLLLVLAASPEARDAHPLVSGTGTGLPTEEVRLPELDRDQVRALLRDRGVAAGAAALLARRLAAEIGGFPGPLLEQLDALVAAGWLVEAPDGALRVGVSTEDLRTLPLPLPARQRAAEVAALARLAEPDRAAFEALAVLDAPAPAPVVAQVAGSSEGEVRRALAALTADGLASSSADGLQEVWAVADRRKGQAAYEALDDGARVALHARAAAALQAGSSRRLAARAAAVARHLVRAGDTAGAYPLLVDAAARKARRGEHAAARELAAQALAVRREAEARLTPAEAARLARQVLLALGDSHLAEGRAGAARQAFEQALEAARAEGDRAAEGRALAGAALAALASGVRQGAEVDLGEALARLERGDERWPEVAAAAAALRFDRGDHPGAAALWDALAELGAEGGSVEAALRAATGQAALAMATDALDHARDRLDEALAHPGAAAAPGPLVDALRLRAELALWEGDAPGAVNRADEIEAVGEAGGVPLAVPWAGGLRAAALVAFDERDSAQRVARVALGLAGVHDPPEAGAWAWPIRVLAPVGEAGAAAGRLGRAQAMPYPPYPTAPTVLALEALAAADRNVRLDAALAALAALAAHGGPAAARVRIDVALALVLAGERSRAAEVLVAARAGLDPRRHLGLVAELERWSRWC